MPALFYFCPRLFVKLTVFPDFLFHLDLKQSGRFFLWHLHYKISIFDLISAHLFLRIDHGYSADLLCIFQRDHCFCCSRCPYRKIGILLCFHSVSKNFRFQSSKTKREERHAVTDFLTDLLIQGDSSFIRFMEFSPSFHTIPLIYGRRSIPFTTL